MFGYCRHHLEDKREPGWGGGGGSICFLNGGGLEGDLLFKWGGGGGVAF